MVFKVSKGGVRTGNTLRGLHSTRTRRYGRHACLVGCTSLGRRDLSRLLPDSSDDEQLVRDTMGKTNVLLSLNKQQRWRLPAIISRMIKQGDFNNGAVVSMLEKHKLKRKANCVSLVSNNPRTDNIAPKQKKYFSFSIDSFTDEQSKREKRRARAAEMQRFMKISKEKVPKIASLYKTIEMYTSDGTPKSNTIPLVDSAKPEYLLEVFYPCPQSCSLAYNPKYTDAIVAEGKTGKMEVQSNAKAPKKGLRTHRKRLTSRDIDRLHCNAIDNDVGEMWEECYEDTKEEENAGELSPKYSKETSIEMLLAQAKKTRDLCIRKKESDHNKNKTKPKVPFSEVAEDKSHIVFIDREEREEKTVPIETSHQVERIPEIIPCLEFMRVVMKTSEIVSEDLRRKYGSLYAEASCLPRRFVIDVTEDVTNLLAWSKASSSYIDFSSYLVCVYDGFYDDGLDVYKVSFNSMIGNDMQGLSHNVPLAETSITEVMNIVVSHLLDLKEQNQLEFVERSIREKTTDFVNSRIKSKVEVFDPSREIISRGVISDENENIDQHETKAKNVLSTDLDEDLFCDVCYDSVTSSRIDSVSGTRLKSCGHLLCDECWASHFRTGMRDGKTVMSCGGYDCNTTVGPVTLMSILNVSEVALLLQRRTEENLDTMGNAKWCPHPECGRVIKVDSKDLCLDVLCACGNKLCFSCLGPAHWPAKCEQAEGYFGKLPSLKPVKEYVEEQYKLINVTEPAKKKQPKIMMVEGRLCPRCDKFIDKNGGCPRMVCTCGFSMCWTCMKSYEHSGYDCKPDFDYVSQFTRTLVVRHATTRKLVSQTSVEEMVQPPKIEKNKQKATMHQRALQQRGENTKSTYTKFHNKALVSKIVKTANQDSLFKMEILKAFSVSLLPEVESSLGKVDVTRYVKKLIEACVGMKQELHHVVEFTFILLQDTPHSVDKQRILKLTNDLSGFCSFVRSILDLQDNQDAKAAFRRMVDLQEWAKRALDALIRDTNKLRAE